MMLFCANVLLLFVAPLLGVASMPIWMEQSPREIDCVAPHLGKPASYHFSANTQHWTAAQEMFGENTTVDFHVSVSTETIVLSGNEAWLHQIAVRGMHGEKVKLLSFVQHDCFQLGSVPLVQDDLDQNSRTFLRRLAATVPLSLQTNRMISTGAQMELTMCTHWKNSSQPYSTRMDVSAVDLQHNNSPCRRIVTKTWIEEEECGDFLRYHVSTSISTELSSTKMRVQRVLFPSTCSLSQNPMLCSDNPSHTAVADDLRGEVVATLTLLQWEDPTTLQSTDPAQKEVMWSLDNFAVCDNPVADTFPQPKGTGLLDNLFGASGRGRLFLEQRFQRSPMVAKGFSKKMVESLGFDAMIRDYQRQGRLDLVHLKNCKLPGNRTPAIQNASGALWHVLNNNCTISLRFEELPDVHMLTNVQAMLESEIFTPVTTHVYVSPRDINALDIHTDPCT